jgi:arginine decarboxylase-like protein
MKLNGDKNNNGNNHSKSKLLKELENNADHNDKKNYEHTVIDTVLLSVQVINPYDFNVICYRERVGIENIKNNISCEHGSGNENEGH